MEDSWLDRLIVSEMDDGGMGSLRLLPNGRALSPETKFGRVASSVEFSDADGIEVSAALYLDDTGTPFELDIWKADFSKLRRIPDKFG